VGLGAAIIRPLISLNGVITRLTGVVDTLEKEISGLTKKNNEAHIRIWERIEQHDDAINGHELRISLIENSKRQ
jgi:C4-type Zn-finger protein